MPDTAFAFHFLRPYWLLALVPAALMLMLILRRERADQQWSGLIAPHLLKHLTVTPPARWRIRPVWLVACALTLAIIAVAGPSWRREVPPFVEDKAPLMVALDVSASMGQGDVAPTRLERGKQKIRDLLAARAGARTGLIAYAGTAHLVMPLTDDRAVIEPFLAALTPGLMPVQGKNIGAAVALAATALAGEAVAGTILLVADGLGGDDMAAVRRSAGRNGIVILAVAPASAVARIPSDADVVPVSVDAGDIRALERRVESHFRAAQGQAGARWRDEGYWLLLPGMALGLLWFRRGTTVQWAILLLLLQGSPLRAEESLKDFWLTPDQQGRLAFERGDYAAAAKLFPDPMWRGIAAYRAFDYLAAAEAFRRVDAPAGRFALGNAEAHNHAYDKAIKAYEEVLAAQPDNAAAKTNIAIVRAALEDAERKRREKEKDQTSGDLPPDETRIDKAQKGGKRTVVKAEDVTTAGAAEAWMRAVQTSPADFLKLKFAIQAASGATPPASAPAPTAPPPPEPPR